MFGRAADVRRHGMAQLTAMLRTGEGTRLLQAQVFSYRSLLTFKLMKEVPLGYRSGLHALRLLMSSFAILGLHHEDRPTPAKRLLLRRGSANERARSGRRTARGPRGRPRRGTPRTSRPTPTGRSRWARTGRLPAR